MAPQRLRVALAGSALLALALLIPFTGYLTDDTFIHLQFAKHLLRGQGFSFNGGEPTYGITSPLWVLLIALVGTFVPGSAATPASTAVMPALAWIAKAYGAVFTALAVLGAARIGRRLGWEPRFAVALALLAAFHPWSARWGVSGMETPLAFFLSVLAFDALAATLIEGAPAWRAGAALAVAALARPEGLLLAVIAGVVVAAGEERAARPRRAASLALGFAVPYGAWLAAAWLQFHRLLPNTGAAKAGAWLDPGRAVDAVRSTILVSLASELAPVALAVVVLAFGGWDRLPRMGRGRRLFWIVVALWPVALTASFAFAGVQVVSRYWLLATPAVLLLGVASLRALIAARRLVPRAAATALALFLGLHAAEGLVMTYGVSAPSARAHTAGLRASLAEIGTWARAHTPPDASFAVSDIGAFGYYSDRRVLDLFGLVTPAMGPVASREGYDAVVANLSFESVGRPEYLVDRARIEARLTSTPDPANPYRFLFSRSIPNLGITRPGAWIYSVYSIDWSIYDREHPRFASR